MQGSSEIDYVKERGRNRHFLPALCAFVVLVDPVILLSAVDVTHAHPRQGEGGGSFPTPSRQSANACLCRTSARAAGPFRPGLLRPRSARGHCAGRAGGGQLSGQSLPAPDTFPRPGPRRL